MGITSFIGMLFTFAIILTGAAFLGGIENLGYFWNVPSVMLVIVPTITALAATYPLSLIAKFPAHMKVILRKEDKPEEYIERIVELANKVRIDGMLALEGEEVQEPIMKFGVQMMIDGIQPEEMNNSLEDTVASMNTRHAEAAGLYEKAAAYAPAFGMCATVVSLVIMLKGLNFEDADAINGLGAAMATALITTFYGSLLANIVFLPIAARLKLLHRREIFFKTLICNGLMSIVNAKPPKFIREALYEQLNNEMRKRGEKARQGGRDNNKDGGGERQ